VGDVRGQNWVATEQIGALLVPPGTELAVAGRAVAAHEAAEDIRGAGWTCQYLALVHARQGREEDAAVALTSAAHHFKECGDELGAAWVRHRRAVLSPSARTRAELELAERQFALVGCRLGQAWSRLELGLRAPSASVGTHLLDSAETHFKSLNDEAGQLWTQVVRGFRSGTVPDPASLAPAPPSDDAGGHSRLLEDLVLFQRVAYARGTFVKTARVWQGPTIPLRARDHVAVSPAHRLRLGRTGTPRCHVRLTLLDDSPGAASTARLLLRVVPDDGHPWLAPDGGPPWLTAVALPLTPAAVEPPSAHLQPSVRLSHGAEFTFTAYRPGTHVIRFTIALEHTGTVLQQVETELEILDTDGAPALTSPRAVSGQRGR
jgi:hypothetical protein